MNLTISRVFVAVTLLGVSQFSIAKGDEQKVEPYELKKKSEFSFEKTARAPFWPIGWQRPDAEVKGATPTVAVVVKAPVIPPGTFKITSVMIGPPSIAVINGRAFEEGEYVKLSIGDQKHRVLIRQIIPEGVWFELNKKMTFEYLYREPEPEFNKPDSDVLKEEFEIIVK